jgi:trimeric autotransporter adhesin
MPMRWNSFFSILAFVGLALPVAAAAQVTHNSVTLTWTATGDDSLTGIASQYDLRYSTSNITASNFASATRWTAMPTPTASGNEQSVTVTGLSPSTTYYFALKVGDEVPNWSTVSNVINRTTLALDTALPGVPTSLTSTSINETSVALRWNASGDDGNTGQATSFDVRYSTTPITTANWNSATQVNGEPAPGNPGTTHNFTVNGLARQTTYYFAVRALDEVGNLSAISNVLQVVTPDQTPPAAVNDLSIGT